jgi:hypothetical protein
MCGGSIRPNRYQMALPLHDSNPVIGGDAPIQACISVGQAF